ncbi:hypothetical protein A7Q01_04890 [Eikenella sp. NML96-A-049]|uniref:DUF4189 domain-containing protein n=1 Tax=unclassified Eikenella TaxID=2639367 RepID=UPI0007E18755|nr:MULTISPECIES: DUF4189 domain-containing protein [unclassified Eikenella]OAM34068.1 hypothetical protein A7P97_02240 [Eikenella sp. NML070372]OAM38813.1 hypothetical protein A7Q01_04890 [Eikenella sp. NML96-A-049]
MKQTMMNTAAGALAALLLGGAGLAWADGFDPWLADGLNKQIQQNREAQQQPTYHGPTAAEIRAWEQREAEVQAEIAELRRTPFWMAIINDFGVDGISWAGGHYNRQRAIDEAMKHCQTDKCQVLTTFSNTCAVMTFPSGIRRSSAGDFFFGYDRDHNRAAEKSIRACEARHGKGNCLYSSAETKHGTAFCTGYDYSNYNQR